MKLTEEQIRELASIFDDIITSDSDAVKSAFHRLAFLSSLAQQDKDEPGPFTDLVNRLDWMERELVDLRRDVQILQNGGQQDFLNDIKIDMSTINISTGGPYYSTAPSVTIAPISVLDTADIITLSQSTLDGFNHGSS